MNSTRVAAECARLIVNEQTCGRNGCPCLPTQRRGHGLTHCVVHQDHTPSLNVTVKGDLLLVTCHAGCAQDDIVTSLKAAEMWPETERRDTRPEIVATYDYRAADETVVYQAVRMFPKRFLQRRPDGHGGWIWDMQGVERVPYRLPEILAHPNVNVFIAEGEKDVDRLFAEGLLATCNVGGAGKWSPAFGTYFDGRKVCLLPDNDDAGRGHMHAVAASLTGAREVRWLDLPGLAPKGDVSDWLDQGGTVEMLRALANAADPPPTVSAPSEPSFRPEGIGYRDEPLPGLVLHYSRLKDHSDETDAELWIERDGIFLSRQRVNLMAGSGPKVKALAEAIGARLDDGDSKRLVLDSFERVLQAHRDGLTILTPEGDPPVFVPNEWLCEPLLLKGKVNCWLGAAGSGKSTLAKGLCVYYAAGFDFLGKPTMQGVPLYLDWEDDYADFQRVLGQVCRELGVSPVPRTHYISMHGKRLRDQTEQLCRLISEHGIGLVVIDAIAAAGAVPGEHITYEAVALEIEQAFGLMPPGVTVLALDHVTSAEHKSGGVALKGRGSERKVEFIRNQWTVAQDLEEARHGRHLVVAHHTKINGDRKRPPIGINIRHYDNVLCFDEVPVAIPTVVVQDLTSVDKAVLYVHENPGCTLVEIAIAVYGDAAPQKKESLRTQLKRKEGLTISLDKAKKYWPIRDPNTEPGTSEIPEAFRDWD